MAAIVVTPFVPWHCPSRGMTMVAPLLQPAASQIVTAPPVHAPVDTAQLHVEQSRLSLAPL